MCQQILQFCSGSTKLLLFAGSLLTLSLAIAIGFIGCTNHGIFMDIDPVKAHDMSLSYYLHLAAAAYLLVVTALGCYAAYYDQKHAIRALAVITSVNLVLAMAAIPMNPSSNEIAGMFKVRLDEAAKLYDFTDKYQTPNATNPTVDQQATTKAPAHLEGVVQNSTASSTKTKRAAEDKMTPKNATDIWDNLQKRGCCGITNATETWKTKFPKSCCSNPQVEGEDQICKDVDQLHNHGCLNLIGSTSMNELIVLALIALVNLYMATITGISTYRTFHYNEASQTAYN